MPRSIPGRELSGHGRAGRLVGMSHELSDTELKQLTGRWIAQWNEPDPESGIYAGIIL